MSAALGSLGQAMYVATKEDTLWLQDVQRALHTRSKEHPDYVFEKLWGLVTAGGRVPPPRGVVPAGGDDAIRPSMFEGGAGVALVAVQDAVSVAIDAEPHAGPGRRAGVRHLLAPELG